MIPDNYTALLREGDQLPTVKDVVAKIAINPNTVLKAYRELEYEGPAAARLAHQGAGGRVGRRKHRSAVRDHLPHDD